MFFLKRIIDSDKEETYGIQKKSILKVLLSLSIAVTFAASVALCFASFRTNDAVNYHSIVNALLFFVFLFILNILGRQSIASKFLSLFYLFFAVVSMVLWGVTMPQALLLHVIAILIASILTNTRFTAAVVLSSLVSIIGVFYLQKNGMVTPVTSWKTMPTELVDVFVYSSSILLIFAISCLYNHEIKKAFDRLKGSEADLRKERDGLEVKVRERTAELEKQHTDQISQASRFIEFGKLSSGIFHDLANHLNVLMLMMDEKMSGSKEVSKAREYLEEFREAKTDFEKFLISNKKRLKEVEKSAFNPDDEIRSVLGFMDYKAKRYKIDFEFLPDGNEKRIYGSSLKFSHIISNLVSNALNAYEKVIREDNRKIIAKSISRNGYYIFEIFDFGCGIKEEDKPKIFNSFFSTSKNGLGLGLGIVRNSVKDDFDGMITFDSNQNVGTVFLIQIPLFENNK